MTEDTAGVVVGVGVTTARQHKASPGLRGRRASTKMKDLQQWRSSPASRSQYIRSDYYLQLSAERRAEFIGSTALMLDVRFLELFPNCNPRPVTHTLVSHDC